MRLLDLARVLTLLLGPTVQQKCSSAASIGTMDSVPSRATVK